jgi:hypothetical protein
MFEHPSDGPGKIDGGRAASVEPYGGGFQNFLKMPIYLIYAVNV